MRFVRRRWLSSFSRQLMVASAGVVLLCVGLLGAGVFAIVLSQGMFSEIGVSEYAETIGEELQFDAAGDAIAVGLPEMPWL
jgi:hypothetical protein